MDIKTLLDNLHEELSCSVCKTTFTNPKTLQCLHSFCLHCLNGILRTSGRHDIIKCPECRGESRVPRSGNLKDLPTNFRINSLLDVLAIKKCDTIGVKCGNCDKESTQSFYCFQCCSFWCAADCVILHNRIKAHKEHRALALKDFQDEDFENVLKRPAFCQEQHHEKEELKFFCKICEIAICNVCALSDHDGHNKILLEEAANKSKIQVKSFIDLKKKEAQQKKNKITQLGESCRQIQEQAGTIKRNVRMFAETMSTLIEAKNKEIFNKLENQERESIKRLVIQKTKIEHQVKMSETKTEETETLFKQGTSAEIAQLDKSVDAFFQEEVAWKEEENVNQALEGLRRLVFLENTKLMEKIHREGIGFLKTFLTAEGKGISEVIVGLEAQFVVSTRNAKGEQRYDKRNCVTVEIRNHQGHQCATKVQVQDNQDGSYKVKYFVKETGKCDVSVKVNEKHIHGSPFVVQVKPRQFKPTLAFGQQGSASGMLSFPWGVAVNGRNEIAVTENGNNRIQIFSSDGTYLRSFGKKGNKQGEFNFPCGIAFDENGNIVVVDSGNHRIQVFNEKGKFLSQFGEQGSLDRQLEGPRGLSFDRESNIIVADRNSKLIKVFSNNGQFTRKIGLDPGSFTDPFHCVQYGEHFVVSESDEHCVKVFDLAGHFLYKFGKKGDGDGEFNIIHCLSVNKAGHLMVCDLWNHRVQVFELSGKFIGKFGTKGKGIGELNRPTSTAVLSDGRIVVTDSGNHRVQIFE